jgi:hypothetical protein
MAYLLCSDFGTDIVVIDPKSQLDLTHLPVLIFLKMFGLIVLANISVTSVENIGVEPMTSCLQSRRSSQLS